MPSTLTNPVAVAAEFVSASLRAMVVVAVRLLVVLAVVVNVVVKHQTP